jgi:peptidoglycan-N-acetylglucosamine deacetylase
MRKFTGCLSIFILSILALTACSPIQTNHSQPKGNHRDIEKENRDDLKETGNNNNNNSPTSLSPKQLAELAKTGRVDSIGFAAHTNTILEVEKQWGPPSSTDKVENSYYATYPAKNIVFGYNEKKLLIDIRSYDKSLSNLTFSQIQKELGEPTYTRLSNNDQIYGYKVDNQFELRFIIPKATEKVDHISVVSPRDVKVVSGATLPYVLTIKGTSNNLSANAWKSMQSWRSEMLSVVKNHQGSVFLNGPDRKMVALTFDDGPDNVNTPLIIDTLAKYKVRGNFFFIGEKIKKFPEVVKKAFSNGNIVLSHSYYHHDLSKESVTEIKADLSLTDQTLYEVIGKRPALIRPPYGAVNDAVITTATKNGENVVLWSIDTLDWSQMENKHITSNVLTNVRNGDIILMHSNEDKAETAAALPSIIEGLQQKGFEIVDLQTLLNLNPYK